MDKNEVIEDDDEDDESNRNDRQYRDAQDVIDEADEYCQCDTDRKLEHGRAVAQ